MLAAHVVGDVVVAAEDDRALLIVDTALPQERLDRLDDRPAVAVRREEKVALDDSIIDGEHRHAGRSLHRTLVRRRRRQGDRLVAPPDAVLHVGDGQRRVAQVAQSEMHPGGGELIALFHERQLDGLPRSHRGGDRRGVEPDRMERLEVGERAADDLVGRITVAAAARRQRKSGDHQEHHRGTRRPVA